MKKKAPASKTKNIASKVKKETKSDKKESNSFISLLPKNLLILVVVFGLFYLLKEYNKGYKWVFTTLIEENIDVIKKHRNLTFEQKMEAKLGFNYRFLNNIKKNTPEDAIIILPPDSIFYPKGQKSYFTVFMSSPGYTTYFVYPRKIVYEGDEERKELYNKATHVAIVNYWGYDKLTYPVEQKGQFAVYPIVKK